MAFSNKMIELNLKKVNLLWSYSCYFPKKRREKMRLWIYFLKYLVTEDFSKISRRPMFTLAFLQGLIQTRISNECSRIHKHLSKDSVPECLMYRFSVAKEVLLYWTEKKPRSVYIFFLSWGEQVNTRGPITVAGEHK